MQWNKPPSAFGGADEGSHRWSRRCWTALAGLMALVVTAAPGNAEPAGTSEPWPWPQTADVISRLWVTADDAWLGFEDRMCIHDCDPGSFRCAAGFEPTFALTGFGGREMAEWFLHDLATYGTQGPRLVIAADGVADSYPIDTIILADSTGFLNVYGRLGRAFPDLLATASTIAIVTPSREFVLPSTPEDLADRAAFAAACRRPAAP